MRLLLVAVIACYATPTVAGVLPVVPTLPGAAIRALIDTDTERDPVKLAVRIGQNARAAGDYLAARNTGSDTRKTQAHILRDLDRLLDQANDPPPQGGEPPPEPPESPEGGEPPPQGGQSPMPQGNSPPPGGDKQPKSQGRPALQPGQPKGGAKSSWRDKAGEPGAEPKGPPPEAKSASEPEPNKPEPAGTASGAGQPGRPVSLPTPPPEDAVAKQVWGHLPERLRREMNQYYKEQFMPKYSDLLRDYYSGLAEASRPAPPRR